MPQAKHPSLEQITVEYMSVDGCHTLRRFDAIEDARAYALNWLGEGWEMGSNYAVSGDSVGTIELSGIPIDQLLPDNAEPRSGTICDECGGQYPPHQLFQHSPLGDREEFRYLDEVWFCNHCINKS